VSGNLDKVLHFQTCFFICTVVALLHPVAGVLVALLAGIAKEFYDSHGRGSGWCWYDLAADALGVIAALLVLKARGV
jgi:uncharacterized membrane protein